MANDDVNTLHIRMRNRRLMPLLFIRAIGRTYARGKSLNQLALLSAMYIRGRKNSSAAAYDERFFTK